MNSTTKKINRKSNQMMTKSMLFIHKIHKQNQQFDEGLGQMHQSTFLQRMINPAIFSKKQEKKEQNKINQLGKKLFSKIQFKRASSYQTDTQSKNMSDQDFIKEYEQSPFFRCKINQLVEQYKKRGKFFEQINEQQFQNQDNLTSFRQKKQQEQKLLLQNYKRCQNILQKINGTKNQKINS